MQNSIGSAMSLVVLASTCAYLSIEKVVLITSCASTILATNSIVQKTLGAFYLVTSI